MMVRCALVSVCCPSFPFSIQNFRVGGFLLLTCKTRPELKRPLKIIFVIRWPLSGTSVRVKGYGPDRHLLRNPYNSLLSFK